MEILEILKKLYELNKINTQAYRTYKGQVLHGDEAACVIGLKRKRLINDKGEIIDGKKINTTAASRENS